MLTWRAHVLGLACRSFLQDLIFPDLRSLLKFLATDNNKALFQLPHVPVGDRILFKHHRKYYSVLQDGMDVVLSFLEVCGVLLGKPEVSLDLFLPNRSNRDFKLKYLKKLFATNNILCLQEVHLGFFGTFIPENENAGGSAICSDRDILLEEAIVTLLITCQGLDHLVNIQSGRHHLVVGNVHFEPELTPALAFISRWDGQYFG